MHDIIANRVRGKLGHCGAVVELVEVPPHHLCMQGTPWYFESKGGNRTSRRASSRSGWGGKADVKQTLETHIDPRSTCSFAWEAAQESATVAMARMDLSSIFEEQCFEGTAHNDRFSLWLRLKLWHGQHRLLQCIGCPNFWNDLVPCFLRMSLQLVSAAVCGALVILVYTSTVRVLYARNRSGRRSRITVPVLYFYYCNNIQ